MLSLIPVMVLLLSTTVVRAQLAGGSTKEEGRPSSSFLLAQLTDEQLLAEVEQRAGLMAKLTAGHEGLYSTLTTPLPSTDHMVNTAEETVNVMVTPPVYLTGDSGGGHVPVLSLSIMRIQNTSYAAQQPPGYGITRAVAAGEVIQLGVSTNPFDMYFLTATTTGWTADTERANGYISMYVLQLRANIEIGPSGETVRTLYWANFQAQTWGNDHMITSDGNGGNFSSGMPSPTPSDFNGFFGTILPQNTSSSQWETGEAILRTGTSIPDNGNWESMLQSGWIVRYMGP
jgi:hypothetical protein